jgi:predicted membrane-bound mannosyltransferase
MAVSERGGGYGGSGWSKWHIALLVGAPVAVGIGVWYLKNRNSTTGRDSATTEDGRRNKISSMTASSYTPSDTAGEEPNVPFEPAEEVWNEMSY